MTTDPFASESAGSTPGVTPEAFRVDEVSRVLQRAAYFSLFSVHDPSRPNVPIVSPRSSNAIVGLKVFERMHRFDVHVQGPTQRRGLRATNATGETAAEIDIDWRVIPEEFVAMPGVLPPPTELDARSSQRFAMYDGHFRWKDGQHSGFRGFGAGRTFPQTLEGRPQLWIGAVVDILEGYGALRGVQGNAVVNGFIRPPDDLALSILIRVVDPQRRLGTSSALTGLRPIPQPDPTATFLAFLGEPDPAHPVTLNVTSQGRVLGATVHELLRPVHLQFDVGTSKGMRNRVLSGPIVGSLTFDLDFDSFDPRVPTPFQTRNAIFRFFERQGQMVGMLAADVTEGRGFQTTLPGAPQPVIRVAGFGPFRSGSGQFAGVSGLLSVNGCISIAARTPSIMYVLRIADPDGRFRPSGSGGVMEGSR